jgi:hypothetical protein
MNTILLSFLCALVAVLATLALAGYIFYRITQRYFDNQQKLQMLQMRLDEHRETTRVVTPIRLQAYERLALYLERISPDSIVLRCYRPGMDTKTLQNAITKAIRDEWEHNLSQQVYVSSEAWKLVRKAKDEMTAVINSAAITIPHDADPARLATAIFSSVASGGGPTDEALEFLKKEMREL